MTISHCARRRILGLVLATWLAACADESATRPSVVLIVVDTLRADRLSCYGYPEEVSPELDALAAGGVRFSRAIAQAPWTRPSIGSLLTSLHPRSLGLQKQVGDCLPQDVDTLAEVFQRHGYATIGATANPNVNSAYEFDQGFDEHFDTDMLWKWMQRVEGAETIDKEPAQKARDVFALLLEAIDGSSGPYYVQANVMDVHEFKKGARPAGEIETERLDAMYAASVRTVSSEIGAFLEALATRPGFEDRIVIVTSDHGEGLHDHPHVQYAEHHGSVLYESQLLVPLIVADTGGRVPAGLVVERPVRLLDLVPTILELVGLAPLEQAQGLSLVPLLSGQSVMLPEVFAVETRFGGRDKFGVWTEEWLFVEARDEHPGTKRVELQANGSLQDGALTDLSLERPLDLERLAQAWRTWSASYPEREPTERTRALSDADIAEFRALGYAGDD